VLVTDNGVWLATSPPVTPLSTVGAGDCTLAGFVMGISDGLSPERALALGVAYGSTAVTLPGTTIPTPNQVDADRITIRALV
jgi:1-phosphofructokinase